MRSAANGGQPAAAAVGTFESLATALDICAAEHGATIVACEEITPHARPGKSAHRVQLSDGALLKLSVSDKPLHAEVALRQAYLDAAGPEHFSRILLHGDNWIASEWIEGTVLSEADEPHHFADRAAALLQRIHRAEPLPVAPDPAGLAREVREKLEGNLDGLTRCKVLSGSQARRLLAMRERALEESTAPGLTHGDFAPDNLVIAESRLVAIDNEDMGIHVPEYDLCRAVNFWDESVGFSHLLLRSYEALSRRTLEPEIRCFWTFYDLAYRARWAIDQFGDRDGYCVVRLTHLLQTELD